MIIDHYPASLVPALCVNPQSGVTDVYSKKIEELTALLNRDDSKTEAVAHIRELISEIRMIPKEDGTHDIDIVGRLASILALNEGKKKRPQSVSEAGSITLVAGACNSRFLRLVESVVPRPAA